MKIVHNAHDSVFKAAMADLRVAKEFFATHLPPAIREMVDLETLELQPNSYVDQSLKTGASDVLYKVKLNDGSPGLSFTYCRNNKAPLIP